ncbi:MAG: hypothetical protein PWP07_2273 [Epulopiscium sp.]|jgi:hypothetical protein|nr:hypothetical protein [Candidatus Epulonipiscium sp.]MDK2810644.1 hypothetical protein [Petroclostridium sp.]
MKKRLLIIRSISFQQLDTNLIEIKKHFEGYEIHLLTHEHGKKLAEKYKDIDKIWIYPYKSGFHFKNKCEDLNKQFFDAIIIPVTNLSGTGFVNVFLFSLTIPAKQRYICNLVSDIKSISQGGIGWLWFRSGVYSLLSYILAAIVGGIGFIIFFMTKWIGNIFKKGSR